MILVCIKAGILYTTFAQIFALVYSMEESILVGESESKFAVFGQSELTDFTENRAVYDGHRLDSI